MKHRLAFIILTTVAVGLLVGSFFAPPTGVIDSSVLAGVGEIFCYLSLWELPSVIREARSVKVKHGDTEIEISKSVEDN